MPIHITDTGAQRINGNVTISGNLSTSGSINYNNTFVSTTSSLCALANSPYPVPGLYVSQAGSGDIASFYDVSTNREVFHIGGSDGIFGVGVNTSYPNKDFTVVGDISATGIIYNNNYSSTNWNNTYTTVNANSATLWNYQGSDLKALSGNWQSTYGTVSSLSSNWSTAYTIATAYQTASATFATNTLVQTNSALLLTRTDYNTSSATFATNSLLQSTSALLLTRTDFSGVSGNYAVKNANNNFATTQTVAGNISATGTAYANNLSIFTASSTSPLTASNPITFTQTVSTGSASGNFTMLSANYINTGLVGTESASLLNLTNNGVSRFKVDALGATTIVGQFGANRGLQVSSSDGQTQSFNVTYYGVGINGNLGFAASKNGVPDTILLRDVTPNIIAMQNGLNANTFRLYNTYWSATSSERATLGWVNNTFTIGTETLPSSAFNRDMAFQTASATRMTITSGGNVGIGIIAPGEKLTVVGNISATGVVTHGGYPVANLPAAASYLFGIAGVTNALAPVVGSPAAGGGAAKCLVCSNGTSWIVTALL